MNFLIDAHLPASLKGFFEDHDVLHASDLPEGNYISDVSINELTIAEKRILITKDSDFYYSFIASGKPYKLVLVKLGNMRLKELLGYFDRNAATLVRLLKENSFVILEPERIRILD